MKDENKLKKIILEITLKNKQKFNTIKKLNRIEQTLRETRLLRVDPTRSKTVARLKKNKTKPSNTRTLNKRNKIKKINNARILKQKKQNQGLWKN